MRAAIAIGAALLAGGLLGWFGPDLARLDLALPAPSQGVGARFPDLPLAGGRLGSLAETRGKVVFINVWAEWCGPCIAELPSIQKLHDRVRDTGQVTFVLIGWQSNHAKATATLSRLGVRLDHYGLARTLTADERDVVVGRGSIPRTYVLDRDGVIRHMRVGSYDWTEAEGLLRDLARQ